MTLYLHDYWYIYFIPYLSCIYNHDINWHILLACQFWRAKKKIRMKELHVFYSDRYNISYNFEFFSFFCFCLHLMLTSLRFVVGVKINHFTPHRCFSSPVRIIFSPILRLKAFQHINNSFMMHQGTSFLKTDYLEYGDRFLLQMLKIQDEL